MSLPTICRCCFEPMDNETRSVMNPNMHADCFSRGLDIGAITRPCRNCGNPYTPGRWGNKILCRGCAEKAVEAPPVPPVCSYCGYEPCRCDPIKTEIKNKIRETP